ncbi:MAG: efflux transporter, family, subunit [Verrucomicrobiales bacterium]|nr:efflux transporter, family, subunit [Verrucomicrobiales bacterium]
MKSQKNKRSTPLSIVVVVCLVLGIFYVTVVRKNQGEASKQSLGSEEKVAPVVRVGTRDLGKELTFYAEFRPFQEIDLHSKVAGFLEWINVDVGDNVREGQVIAKLEIPELESESERAFSVQRRSEEEIKHAQVVYEEAQTIYERLSAVEKAQPNLIARQEIDTASSREKSASSALSSAKEQAISSNADIKKYKSLLGYANITAPFAGVVTKRYADKGALIQAGTSSSTQTMPLIRLSENNHLRLSFPVSVSHVSQIHIGDTVSIFIPSLNKRMEAKISRLTRKVEVSTRTMDAEIDINNPNMDIIPGVYANVSLNVNEKKAAIALPVDCLSHETIPTILVLDSNNVFIERPVETGLETASYIEVLNGVKAGDLVLVGSRAGFKAGQKVKAKIVDIKLG